MRRHTNNIRNRYACDGRQPLDIVGSQSVRVASQLAPDQEKCRSQRAVRNQQATVRNRKGYRCTQRPDRSADVEIENAAGIGKNITRDAIKVDIHADIGDQIVKKVEAAETCGCDGDIKEIRGRKAVCEHLAAIGVPPDPGELIVRIGAGEQLEATE